MQKLKGYKTLLGVAAIILLAVGEGLQSGDMSSANWVAIGTSALFAAFRFITTTPVGSK